MQFKHRLSRPKVHYHNISFLLIFADKFYASTAGLGILWVIINRVKLFWSNVYNTLRNVHIYYWIIEYLHRLYIINRIPLPFSVDAFWGKGGKSPLIVATKYRSTIVYTFILYTYVTYYIKCTTLCTHCIVL